MSSNIRVKRICQQCGKEFEARTTVTKTCSDTCAKRAYKARQRAAKIEFGTDLVRSIQRERPLEEIRAEESLNMADAGRLLGVSRWTIWRAITNGNLRAVKLGRRTIIRRSDIDRLFDRPAELIGKARVEPVPLADCYTMKEIQQKYSISDKALYELIRRNEIPKQYSGIYAYVPKVRIDQLLATPKE